MVSLLLLLGSLSLFVSLLVVGVFAVATTFSLGVRAVVNVPGVPGIPAVADVDAGVPPISGLCLIDDLWLLKAPLHYSRTARLHLPCLQNSNISKCILVKQLTKKIGNCNLVLSAVLTFYIHYFSKPSCSETIC
jgi:hypothetical protein